MRDIAPETLEAIGRGDLAHAELMLFDLPSGLYGFWRGFGTLSLNGIDYVGAGSLISVEQIEAGIDISASPLRIVLRAVPETALSPDILATIDDEQYKGRPFTLLIAWFDRTTGAVAAVEEWARGYVDTVDHDETVGGDYALVAQIEPRSLDHSRRGWRMRSDQDQKLLDPADRFFEHAATVGSDSAEFGRGGNIHGGGQEG